MLRYAKEEERNKIYEIWKDIFSFDDQGYTDYFFQHQFNPNDTVIKEVEDKIVSIGSRTSHTYRLKNRLIKASMIYGIATLEQERGKGYMHEILTTMLDHLSHQELITFIQAYDPKKYEKYGFVMAYYKKEFTLTSSNVEKVSTNGCTKEIHPVDLLRAYGRFCSLFDGYQVRDEAYFENYINEVRAQNGDIVAC
ncbi:MAG: GNAT family N-acetyltransferase, partial [Erysipelotrichaceae bacterium]